MCGLIHFAGVVDLIVYHLTNSDVSPCLVVVILEK